MEITIVLAIMETVLYVFLYYIFVNHFNKYEIRKKRYLYLNALLAIAVRVTGICIDINKCNTGVCLDRSVLYTILQIVFLFSMNRGFKDSFCKITIGMQYIVSVFLFRQLLFGYVCWFIERYVEEFNNSFYGRTMLSLQLYYVSMCIFEIVFLVSVLLITGKKKIEYISKRLFLTEFILYCSSYILQKEVSNSEYIVMVLVNALIFVLNLAVFIIMYQYSSLKTLYEEKKFWQEEVRNAEELYENIQEAQNTIRNIRHDIKNRLIGILGAVYSQERSWENVQKEIEKIVGAVDGIEVQRYCNNTKINSILYNKLKNVDTEKIDINIKMIYLEKLNIDYGDIGVIIGNLLDNAIEACNYVYNIKPYILIRGYEHNGYWYFVVENSKSNARPLKTSAEHGRGIKNVQRILEKYHAVIRIEEGEEKYKTEVKFMIGLPHG